jgi:hypothetical protein
MKQDFMFPVTGWLRDLSPKARKAIAKRVPALSVDNVSRAAGYYALMRDADHPSPDEARKTLLVLQQQARELNLGIMRLGPLHTFVMQAAAMTEGTEIETWTGALCDCERALAKARTYIPKGVRRSPKDRFISELAALFQEAGEPISAKPKGAFCAVVDIVLRDVGEEPSDVRKIVKPLVSALENARQKQKAFSSVS